MAPNENKFNADELEAPEWINTDFFTKVLKHCEKENDVKVLSIKITPGSSKGDHYASVMFRALVDYQTRGVERKSKSLILKTMPDFDGHKKEFLGESYIFETEISMYEEILPKFEQILRAVGDETVLSAKCLYSSLSPKKLMVFEDIVPLGYEALGDRQASLEEAKIIYMKIAKWHAISYKLLKEDPKMFEHLKHGFMTVANLVNGDFLKDGITNFIKMLDNVPSLQKYKTYFESAKDSLMDKCRQSQVEYRENPPANVPFVLCHGDFHAKNCMYKNNAATGAIEDVMLLDFQLCYVGSIVSDLIYSFYMILSTEQRLNDWDEILYFYYTNFSETLRKIGFEGTIPKLTEFRAEFRRHTHYDIFLISTFLPMWYTVKNGDFDPELLMTSSDFRGKTYRDPDYIAEVEKLLQKFLHLGYFE